MIIGTYSETYGELLEDQWLLKIRDDETYKTGFLTKLTKKKELPVKFKDWGDTHIINEETKKWEIIQNTTIYVWNESFRSGWTLKRWRIGMSQEWAVVQHPEGFLLEIYLDDFLNLVLNETIEQGVIVGEFKWENSRLIKKI